MKKQLPATHTNPLRLVIRVLFMLAVPLAGFALFAGNINITHATDYLIQMKDHSYQNTTQPADGANISIPVGGTVEWTNPGPLSHNVAILDGPDVNVSPEVKPGDTWSMIFTVPGTYHYFCEFHPGMEGDVIVGGSASTAPVGRSVQTFAETGKTVRGLFLDYWNAHGGLAQQGFPISEEIQEKSDTNGKIYTVQYFERAVLESHPENPAPNNVLLSLLGNFLYKQKYPDGAPGQQPNASAGSVLFPETGHRVGGLFLDYWNGHGGLSQQGFPISDEFTEKNDLDGNTYRVQYFERAVFEYHPENVAPYDVLLSQLDKFRYDKVSTPSPPDANGIQVIGLSSGPEYYPLMSGPQAAPGLDVWIYENDPQPVVGWLTDLGVKYVEHQLSWNFVEPQQGVYNWPLLDNGIDALTQAGIHVVLNPVHAPGWAQDTQGQLRDPGDLEQFMKIVAARYKGKVIGYDMWNEPNLQREVGKYVISARYAELLKAGYRGVKASDPTAVVISAALTPTGLNDPEVAVDDVIFLRLLYAYNGGELKGYFDVLGAHPGSSANPPDTLYPDDPGPGPGWNTNASFYFRRIEQLRQVMLENGDAQKQMWLTEFGWASTPNPAPGYEYASQNSEEQQAQYIGDAFRMGRDQYPWMGPMFLFQLNIALPNVSTDPNDERIAWGIIRRDGTKRPAYFAVQDYAKEWNSK
jgi:polysaccharide biosynthesis protein PslG